MYLSHLLVDVGVNPDRPRPGRLWLRNVYRVHQRLCMAFPDAQRKAKDPRFLRPFEEKDFPETNAAKEEITSDDVHQPRSAQNGFLFRIDHDVNVHDVSQDGRAQPCESLHELSHDMARSPVILVLSAREPDWNYAFQNAPLLNAPLLAAAPEKKAYTVAAEQGQEYRFRLKANTVRKVANGPLSGGRVSVGRDPAALMDWLWRRGEANGFEPVFEKKENGWDPRWRIESGLLHAWREKNLEERTEEKNGDERKKMSFAFGIFDGVLRVKDPALLVGAVESGIGPAKAFGFGLLSLARISP